MDTGAADVDCTLLNSAQQLTERTQAAVKAAAKLGVPTVVATGKVTDALHNEPTATTALRLVVGVESLE